MSRELAEVDGKWYVVEVTKVAVDGPYDSRLEAVYAEAERDRRIKVENEHKDIRPLHDKFKDWVLP